MASDGLTKKAKKGTCRICQRVRNTDNQVKAVAQVSHGFATGHLWECVNIEDCDKTANDKLKTLPVGSLKYVKIEVGLKQGRFKEYKYFS